MKYRIISLLVSFTILALLMILSGIEELIESILKADALLVGLAVLTSVILIFIRVIRWDLLLKGLNIRAKFSVIFHVYMGGMFISNLTPGKTGDPIRSYFLKKNTDIPFSKNLPSVIIERIFDIVTMGIGAVLGVFVIAAVAKEIGNVLGFVIVIYAAAIFAFIYYGTDKKRLQKLLNFFFKYFHFIPRIKRMSKKAEHFAFSFNRSFMKYKKRPKHLASGLLLSFVVWLLDALIIYFALLSLGLEVSYFSVFFLMSIAVLVGVLSALPGGIGSFEVVIVLLLTSLYDLPLATTTAAVLIARFAGFWLNMGIGAFSLGFKI